VPAGLGAELAASGCAVVEQHRTDALQVRRVVTAQVGVARQQRPALQHMLRRDVALRDPARLLRLAHQLGIRLVGFRMAAPPPQRRRVGRLGQHRPRAGPDQFVDHVPPAGTRLDNELHVVNAGEAGQPRPQMRPVRRSDLPPQHLTRDRVHIVERQLLPVHVQRAYDPPSGPPQAP
jgi:hypothetical protein